MVTGHAGVVHGLGHGLQDLDDRKAGNGIGHGPGAVGDAVHEVLADAAQRSSILGMWMSPERTWMSYVAVWVIGPLS